MWHTHEIFNQFDELSNYDLFATDLALRETVQSAGSHWAEPMLAAYGARIGSEPCFEQAREANAYPPQLQAFDARGRRVDRVRFHPSWHALLAQLRQAGWMSLAFRVGRPGRWVANMAGMYLHCQVESGTACPATMTWASIPLLAREPTLWPSVSDKLFSLEYDARDVPLADKPSMMIGMGMTEKQGGSDVRANTTSATPLAGAGRGAAYRIRGHKWFFSAPTSDAHLVVARTPGGGHSCLYVPRWLPDGSRNAVRIQRLKDKVGNRSNASAEVEFQDATGWLIDEEERGIPAIIEMASYTRLSCVVSSAAFLRQALVQALAYTRQREAFGRVLAEQPLMRAVLVDLALESEAAMTLAMRLAQAFEQQADEAPDDPLQRFWKRAMTPAAKFWVCKRAVTFTGEAMEIFGGNGYVEDGSIGRLFREAPVNSIWEGSGNVMCLDVMRAVAKDREAAHALLDGLDAEAGAASDRPVQATIQTLRTSLASASAQPESLARLFAQRLVLAAQAVLLRAAAPAFVADAFIATRFAAGDWERVPGAIDIGSLEVDALLERALPR